MSPPGEFSPDALAAAFTRRADDPFGLIPALAEISDENQATGYISALAGNPAEFEATPERIRATRKILHLFGYLPGDSRLDQLDPPLRDAIVQFQSEAGLAVDGWVGFESWTALEDLFIFEGETEIARWIDHPARDAVLRRAVRRRLVALGLLEEQPDRALLEHTDLAPAIAAFADLANELALASLPVPGTWTRATLAALFDHDGMVVRLGRRTAGLDTPATRQRLGPFVNCVARIELWLLHYEVVPDGGADPAAQAGALKRFAGDLAARPAGSAATATFDPADLPGTFPAFFSTTAALAHAGEAMSPADLGTLADELARHPETYQKTWLDRVKAIGGRLWDGLKRLWGWFKNLFRAAADQALVFVRLAYRLASNSLAVVRDLFAAFPAAVQYWFSGDLPGPRPALIAIRHGGDFDFRAFGDHAAPAAEYAALAGRLALRTTQFVFVFRGLRLLLDALATAGAAGSFAFTGPVGVLRFAAGLVGMRAQADDLFDYWRDHHDELMAAS